jgi:hypothetical protein
LRSGPDFQSWTALTVDTEKFFSCQYKKQKQQLQADIAESGAGLPSADLFHFPGSFDLSAAAEMELGVKNFFC